VDAVVWLARQVAAKVVGIAQRLLRWAVWLPARLIRLGVGLGEGVRTLRPWALAWWRSLAAVRTWRGLPRWLGYRLVELGELIGVGEFYETLADLLKFNTRRLTEDEIAAAASIFGDAIRLRRVRLDARALLGPAKSKRPYTSFHTVNGWGRIRPEVLVHELTHVWQYECDGAIYMPQALYAQHRGAGYDYRGPAGLTEARAQGLGLRGFNREQQAQIVEDFAAMRAGHPDAPLYASFVAEVSTLPAEVLLANMRTRAA
jgi:hypothetical protein